MCIFHKWVLAEMTEGMRKRGCTGRRVCMKCGRLEIRKSSFYFGGNWLHNRDVDPKQIRVLIPRPVESD